MTAGTGVLMDGFAIGGQLLRALMVCDGNWAGSAACDKVLTAACATVSLLPGSNFTAAERWSENLERLSGVLSAVVIAAVLLANGGCEVLFVIPFCVGAGVMFTSGFTFSLS